MSLPVIEAFIEGSFSAAHFLPNVPEGHKCRKMHGHNYRVRITISGPMDWTTGWIVDFAEIHAAWNKIRETLDHGVLNEVQRLENPTAEVIAHYIFEAMVAAFPGEHGVEGPERTVWRAGPSIEAVEVRENDRCGAICRSMKFPNPFGF